MKIFSGVLTAVAGFAVGSMVGGRIGRNKQQSRDRKKGKFEGYFYILDRWMTLKEKGKTTEAYFIQNGFRRIAIYGMGIMGRHLYEDLRKTGVEIVYAIDRNAARVYENVPVKTPDGELHEVDAVIVTATFDFEEIEEELQKKLECPIISLDEVLAMAE